MKPRDEELHRLWREAWQCKNDFLRIEILCQWQDRLRVLEGRNKAGRHRKKDVFDEDE